MSEHGTDHGVVARPRSARVRAMVAPISVGALLALAGCPQFHASTLPGTPADATFVEVEGVQVRYREAGQGPAVVLIHGFGASSDSWMPVMPALVPDHRVIAVDLKGFGWSTRPDGDYSPGAQARLVWGVLDRLRVKNVAIVAHSWGSSVALSMAVARPAQVRRVALYAAYVYDDQVPSFFRWAEKPGLGELLFGIWYRERIEDRAALAYHDERWVTQERVERVERELARPGTVAAALAAARSHQFAALHERVKSFAKPVLLLWGENDQVTPVRFAHRLVSELPNAQLKTYPRCGHIPMVEAHAPSTRDLADFLAADREPPPPPPAPPPTEPAPSEPVAPTDGGGAGGGSSGGHTAGGEALETREEIIAYVATRLGAPRLVPDHALAPGADLATLGIELAPRNYAAPRERVELIVHGSLRARDAQLYNLDLDRGLDSRGQPLYPIPLGGGQRVDAIDLRARTDVAFHAPGVGVAVKARIDWLDNIAVGGDPDLANGSPATTSGQRPTTVVIKRAWGEALTPIGTVAVGRMGAHFGLGMAVHGGDCEDCDHNSAADRAAFVSPIANHLVAVAYDIASRGPFTRSKDGARAVSLEPSDRAAGPTVAVLKVHSPAALQRRADAGRTSVEYAVYASRRTQARDVPASYLPAATPREYAAEDLMARDFAATATGAWLRVSNAWLRVEGEVAYAAATLGQPSLIPGAELTQSVTSQQLGVAVESDVRVQQVVLGVNGGYASGDAAPGFGAFPRPGETAPPAGALDGAQADLPRDRTVDNFRFSPDYRIDQILFREIIGTVTDAIYVRPHVRLALLRAGAGQLELGTALVASWAVEATSTPSGARALGIELDPELRYAHRDGFAATVSYGLLLPGAAFDNTELAARPAQALRVRMAFAF